MSTLSPQVCVQAETLWLVRLEHRRLPLAAVNDVMKRMKHAHNRTEDTKETQQEKPHGDVRSETSRDGRHEWNEPAVTRAWLSVPRKYCYSRAPDPCQRVMRADLELSITLTGSTEP